jgi:hypothetical protein
VEHSIKLFTLILRYQNVSMNSRDQVQSTSQWRKNQLSLSSRVGGGVMGLVVSHIFAKLDVYKIGHIISIIIGKIMTMKYL